MDFCSASGYQLPESASGRDHLRPKLAIGCAVALLCLAPGLAWGAGAAQGSGGPPASGGAGNSGDEPGIRYYAGPVGFGYLESAEDGLSGRTLGGGGTIGISLAAGRHLEAEVAVPRLFRDGDVRHRDIALSLLYGWRVSGDGNRDVFVLAGPALLRSQTRSPLRNTSSTGLSLTVGADWRIRLGENVALVPQARVHVTAGTVIFRPGVGIQWTF